MEGLRAAIVYYCLTYSLSQILRRALIAVLTWIAVRVAYRYILAQKESPVDFSVPLPPEVSPDWRGKSWSEAEGADRELLEAQSFGKFDTSKILSYCPADGRLLGNEDGVKPASPGEIDLTVRRAVVAHLKFKKTTFSERRKVLRTLLKYILEHQDEIVAACCLDSGKTKVDACFGEILVTVEKLKWTIDHGEKALRTDSRPTNLLMMYKKNTVRYEPLGVVAACVSWNYPFHNFISPVISAIFAGNSIIVKPSEHTAWSSSFFQSMIREAIVSCGYSEFLVQSLVCLPQHADVLTSHRKIDHIIFIGSRPVAHEVCKSAAKALTPVTVELGGKDPVVVLDDPSTLKDLPNITSILMRGVFQSAGQNCVGAERIIALPRSYNKILEIITPRIKALRLGSVLLDSRNIEKDSGHALHTPDVGAIISQRSFDLLEALISEAVGQGAKLICGGKRYNHPLYPHGHYFTPTLLANVTREMRIAQMELFAPVFLLMRAADLAEAVTIANSTEYALGSSVFGHRKRDVEYCVSNLNAGMVAVNDFGAYYAVGLPFGGLKGSGYGRFGGAEGLRNLSNLKAVCEDGWPFIQTKIPPTLDYPIQKGESAKKDGRGAWEMCKGVVETGYHPSLNGKINGVWKILNNI
ncbi:Meiotic Sister-Chromatid recombination aldehyde dehydrogenase [Ophidiomyces ophidiicola]|uniref:Meiotic Sister-Chromatid recombination aldehyde dehydrogenase n=1 Tax=Ophidiomyces ophidiicola TaxID=1387563 RepID=A0ACB8V421_9EURO|nr:Meiotic Sister-Chromatid recombination aldehyde dehydrogenase [Ophidiomyces ophidiicola]KAI1971240.1 Meiotic Sister-Chromatid recombination aldehyde dehydrogenase [Ophidiomyces ophidiicola]KAI2015969.1 Meiotic Sister-Chromatid recombination aldehyde dehydrogenase [Ophidiomyces ophidiicola]KAI2026233.1 Meiotic Sister-Chromatid recombination aldehyde dehydrogenase [Ophidiomyces ophidiicola]KAI2049501.1 Meiotic Sister-Chromatid recombination aldehyde dehydrogenase [Ophidiomyces ophidiicola]